MTSRRVTEAVNLLIEAPNYAALINEITRFIETWDTHPMVYGGHLACLNALIDVGLTNRTAFEQLVQLINQKRREHPAIKRVDYQRELMRDRRARIAKALELHETKFGKLRGAARMAEMKSIQERWAQARKEFMANKGPLDWKGRNMAAAEFWDVIDRNLDENLAQARRALCA